MFRFNLFEGLFDAICNQQEENIPERVDIIEDLSEVIEVEEVIEDWTEGNPNPEKISEEYLYVRFPFLR